MTEVILLKYGEIALKGLNRSTFESILIKNIRYRLSNLGEFSIKKAQSTIYVEPLSDSDMDEVFERLSKVFGISSLSRAAVCDKNFEVIAEKAARYLKEELLDGKSFKVIARRADKQFPMNSPEICRELGGYLLERFPNLSVDVHTPDVEVVIEVRDFGAYIHSAPVRGAGGMPVGSSGRAMLMLSGGIDSPVAGYMMAKRGLRLSCIHFESPPYTSERARNKVLRLAEILKGYTGRMNVFIVPFTEIQEQIKDRCPEEVFTLVMRRMMVRIANGVAEREGCEALITGESLGQVASQTMAALSCTDVVSDQLIMRPLIGMDKEEIVAISRKIGTFETSILPYEDCCTVFTPRHPKTNPKLDFLESVEKALEIDHLVEKAVRETTATSKGTGI